MDQDQVQSGIDEILKRLVLALTKIESSQKSAVRLPKAEIDFLGQLELARNHLLDTLHKHDRSVLLAVYGGDCSRIARIRALCEAVNFSQMNAGDQRLSTCLSACSSVEQVIVDKGFGRQLQEAQQNEKETIEAEDDGSYDECIKHVAAASVAESEALVLEQVENSAAALVKYQACQASLEAAIAAAPKDSADYLKLKVHCDEVKAKVCHLRSLEEGSGDPGDTEIRIVPVDLGMQRNKARGKKLMGAIISIARLRLANSREIMNSALGHAKKHSEAKKKLVACIAAIARLRLVRGRAMSQMEPTMSEGEPKNSDESLDNLNTCMKACETLERDMEEFGLDLALCEPESHEAEVVDNMARQLGGDSASYMQPVADAMAAEAHAVELAREGRTMDALQKYTECKRSLATAVVVLRAAAKFKAAITVDFEGDESKLHAFEEHIGEQIQKLEGHTETLAADDFLVSIHPEELSMDEYTLS
eukprot:TRINITY_DN23501_c0_g1_i2.p1 TRINITY_DN23501_c0_g1~~TRINITY_DN23501_c0_g1_i2.p1  ORF type:complete len:477 (-),score=104.91 TRINITY_DN23501_c0_g1_i2:88-1518(-)